MRSPSNIGTRISARDWIGAVPAYCRSADVTSWMQFAQAWRITSRGSSFASGRPVLHSIALGDVARSRELARIKAFRRQGLRAALSLGCGGGLVALTELDEFPFVSCQSETTKVPRP